MSADIEAIRRQLKIKTGSVRRLLKENGLYRAEAADNQAKLDKLRADGAEEWDVKNATRLVQESEKMIEDTKGRLGRAVGELRDLVDQVEKQPELAQDEEFLKAKEALEEAAI
ncbi:tubulin binding cofactor A-domain-containing protein [Vararia minispora EC-137]|uniref:Tubulin binding cofactor A-domain-containing protein n=1 Tax=Vararia minispora EC-137 TaxID=1314806 RepID=A0ACB8Q9Y8_9AGAM|nr:tubulin binding cofactor A-domain-containing protein [Vararia minispora EC-137]